MTLQEYLETKLGEMASQDPNFRERYEDKKKSMKVVQCYGACDKFTLYHDRIVNLVNNNMNMIKQCLTSKQIAI
jgi:hypothetical protein